MSIVLYCVVLYCITLYCVVCIVLYCIVLYCIVLYCIVLYCIVLYCIVLYCIVLYCIVLYCSVFINYNLNFFCCYFATMLKAGKESQKRSSEFMLVLSCRAWGSVWNPSGRRIFQSKEHAITAADVILSVDKRDQET